MLQYKISSHIYVTDKIVPVIYDRIKIKTNISQAVSVSAITGMWSCLPNNASFGSIENMLRKTEYKKSSAARAGAWTSTCSPTHKRPSKLATKLLQHSYVWG